MFKQVCAFLALIIVLPIYASQSLTGVVYSKNKHAKLIPIANAKVQLHGHNHSELTDEAGRFVIELDTKQSAHADIIPHTYELHISANGFQHKNLLLNEQKINEGDLEILMATSVIEQLDVYASPLHSSTIESASAISVISDEELRNKHSSTLGDTLKSELGVHSSYFGPVSSSPILRGLDGPRVMITQNGLDVSDASRVGPDHVVSTETSTVKQIEILRGPATLLFGNGAIGGVINVVDNRVPTNTDFEADYQVSHNTVANENELSVNLTKGFDNVAVHFDAFTRSSDDYKIPGEAESEDAHDDEEHEEGHEEDHEEESSGVLANTAADADGFNIGASYLFDSGYIGISFGQLNRLYGIPGHSHEEHEEEGHGEDEHEEESHDEELVQGDMQQNRVQILSEFEFDHSFITALQTKVGFTDYKHAELENGVIGTQFKNKTSQIKSDLIFAEMAGWHGALSFEYKKSDFSAQGDEAFTPASSVENTSVALLEERHLGSVLLQLGARVESISLTGEPIDVNYSALTDEQLESVPSSDNHIFDFTPISLSSGIVWDFTPGYNLGVSLTRSERAPSASELLSLGPHIGTSSFEVGSVYTIEQDGEHHELTLSSQKPELETATNAELTIRKFNGDFGFIVNVFYNTIDNFYYQNETGLLSTELFEHDEHEEHE
ncbi:TonB-dependent receptor, partial [Psychrosphaera sp. F3M07]|uniref:TonB-dependent receptor n=1 Tax=Psychrosphaera sp. F3M07 TaxID=2841560 RepID=UPI001C08A347